MDSWTEAGSAPFAERHFPFEKILKLNDFFPPDFVTEYTGQIRAWFYVLHVIATAIYGSHAFKNVLVTGVILGTDGRKMSKNFGNYPDPKEMLRTYGGDALRLYLMSSPVMKGEDIRISEQDYRDQVKNFLLLFWNVYNFFVTYADLDNWRPEIKSKRIVQNRTILDEWIINMLRLLTIKVTEALEAYDPVTAISLLQEFLNDLSRWYIRRSRGRVGVQEENSLDKELFYQTSYFVLINFCKLVSVFAPFVTEEIYKNLTKEESVHLTDWPKSDGKVDMQLLEEMQILRTSIEKVHAQRKAKGIPVRQPLNQVSIFNYNLSNQDLIQLIKDEVNVKNILFKKGSGQIKVELDTKITPELEEEAKTRELIRKIQGKRKEMGIGLTQRISVKNPWLPKNLKLTQKVKNVTLARNIEKGDFEVTLTS